MAFDGCLGMHLEVFCRSRSLYNREIRIFSLSMPVNAESIKQDLDRLTHNQLQQVADFIAFLKFRNQRQHRVVLDPAQLSNWKKWFC